MAVIRRHWKFAILNVLVFALSVGAIAYFFSERRVRAELSNPPAAVVLDANGYCRVRAIRQACGLASMDLAAAGCDGDSAAVALAALGNWYSQNAQRLTEADAAERVAHDELAEAVRRAHVGPRDESALAGMPNLKRSLTAAESARKAIEAEGVAVTIANLSFQQKQVLAAAAENNGVPGPLRYVGGLTDKQKEAGRIAAAKGQSIEANVSGAQQACATARSNQQQFSEGVILAEANVLPVPAELIERATQGDDVDAGH